MGLIKQIYTPMLLVDLMYKGFLLVFTILLTSALIAQVQNTNAAVLTPEDNEAKQNIITNQSAAVDHRWGQYDLILGSKKGDNSTFTIYNLTGNFTVPPVVCGTGTHEHDGICVPNPPPEPTVCPPNMFFNTTSQQCQESPLPPIDNNTNPVPEPTNNDTTKVTFAGDFDGTGVINAMKAKNADYNIAAGDLGYKSDLSSFKSSWDKLNNNKCTPGNHDQAEDGSSSLAKESSAYCGDIWTSKVAGGTTAIIGVNTNGNLDTLLGTAQTYLTSNLMQGVKNVVLVSHKPCEVHPGAHHTVESSVKTFCQSFDGKVPAGVNIVHISAHNHEIGSKSDGSAFLVGGGGKTSHRGCGTGSGWDFCAESNGFLMLEINNDSGEIKSNFYNTNGGVIN